MKNFGFFRIFSFFLSFVEKKHHRVKKNIMMTGPFFGTSLTGVTIFIQSFG